MRERSVAPRRIRPSVWVMWRERGRAEGAVKDAEASANQRGAESQRCGCFLEVERGQCGQGSEGRARGSLTEMMGRH